MYSVNMNNTNYNVKFKAAAPKPPLYKRMLTGYENFESRSENRVRETLLAFLETWEDFGEALYFLLFGLIIGGVVCLYRSMDEEPKRVRVEDTQEYFQQYKKSSELYEESILINGEYVSRLKGLLPEYDRLIRETNEKMDNTIQLRISRSEAKHRKDPVTGKYSYTVNIEGDKAVTDVQTE